MPKLSLPKNYVALIDELGRLEADLEKITPKLERAKVLRGEIGRWCDQMPADQEYVVDGDRYAAAVSRRDNQRKIVSLGKIFRVVGQAEFLKVCSLTLKALDSLIPRNKQGRFVLEERTGKRTVKLVRRFKAAA
jgi:hypothetical protein